MSRLPSIGGCVRMQPVAIEQGTDDAAAEPDDGAGEA